MATKKKPVTVDQRLKSLEKSVKQLAATVDSLKSAYRPDLDGGYAMNPGPYRVGFVPPSMEDE